MKRLCAFVVFLPVMASFAFAAITPKQVIHLVNNSPDCLTQFDTWIVGHGLGVKLNEEKGDYYARFHQDPHRPDWCPVVGGT